MVMHARLFRSIACRLVFLLTAAVPPAVEAQSFPARPVRFIVGMAAGGVADSIVRTIAEGMTAHLGQTVLVDNMPGAAGAIGMNAVANAAPDGYTIGYSGLGLVALTPLFQPVSWDPIKSFAHVSMIVTFPHYLMVSNSLNVNTLGEFISLVKANPGKFNYSSDGIGSTTHVVVELFKMRAGGLNIVHVPVKGSPDAIRGFAAGDIHMAISTYRQASLLRDQKTGKILAAAGAARGPELPDVPTMREAGLSGIEMENWLSVVAPSGIPRDVLLRLNQAINVAATRPEAVARMNAQGFVLKANTADEMASLVAKEVPLWREVVQRAGIRPGQ